MAKMLNNVKKAAPQVLGLTVGNVAAGFASKMIPVQNNLVKNGIVLLGGVLLMGQKGLLSHVGAGMASQAGASMVREAVPAIGAFEDDINGIGDDDDFFIEGVEDDINGPDDVINGNDDDDDDDFDS
jgi:hypothetical protein